MIELEVIMGKHMRLVVPSQLAEVSPLPDVETEAEADDGDYRQYVGGFQVHLVSCARVGPNKIIVLNFNTNKSWVVRPFVTF